MKQQEIGMDTEISPTSTLPSARFTRVSPAHSAWHVSIEAVVVSRGQRWCSQREKDCGLAKPRV